MNLVTMIIIISPSNNNNNKDNRLKIDNKISKELISPFWDFSRLN